MLIGGNLMLGTPTMTMLVPDTARIAVPPRPDSGMELVPDVALLWMERTPEKLVGVVGV